MNRLVAILISVLFFSCSYHTQPMSSGNICDSKPPAEASWLCYVAAKNGVTLNDVDSLLLDASAVAVLATDIEIAKVKKFLDEAEAWVDIENITYLKLIEKMEVDAEKAGIIKQILARHIYLFKSDLVVSSWDKYLIRLELKRQREQFGI